MYKHSLVLFACLWMTVATAQSPSHPITYYLPDISYDENIPSPEDFLGWQIGDWHISHDLQVNYMRALANASDRVTLTEYARSHEQRPLVYLTITSPENHQNLETLKQRHVDLSDPSKSARINIDETPLVLYQGFSIHGNEPSGGNAAPLVAYYLAAGQSDEVDALLNDNIVLLDPCYNPDGFNRFSTWANVHRNLNMTPDGQDREYDEAWPGGRTNHYWFDLNRDWLPVQHPESRGRITTFHEWKPNILTDHHEMGTHATFFFMPGEPTRVHPLTPERNQELTGSIGDFHAAALDDIGSLYYSREGYDDFYYGKGSTYPDVNGCIGILFEQASSRGHMQETDNGLMTFPFTIRNQVTTALSTQAAAVALKNDILVFQRDFYQNAMNEAAKDNRFGYVFGDDKDKGRTNHFLDILLHHQVEVHELANDVTVAGQKYEAGSAYVVPMEQSQYRFIKSIFDPISTFTDSIFYDISTWNLPMAFNLPYGELTSTLRLGNQITDTEMAAPKLPAKSDYAYLLPWNEFYAPRAAYQLMEAGLRLKVTTQPFSIEGNEYPRGTVFLPVQNQSMSSDEIHSLVHQTMADTEVPIYAVSSGLTAKGPDLGSRMYHTLRLPKVMLLIGEGVTSYDIGSNWYLLDQRYHMPVTKVDAAQFRSADLDRYNTMVIANGRYNSLGQDGVDKIKEWVSAGGVLIIQKSALNWARSNGLAQLTSKNRPAGSKDERPYDMLSRDNGGQVLGGAIFQTKVDLTHPMLYGFQRENMPSFHRGNNFYQPSNNRYATPIRYTSSPFLSGYVHDRSLEAISESATIIISGTGSGRTICMVDEPAFRAFWFGTSKLLANAIFFGHTISGSSVERVKGE